MAMSGRAVEAAGDVDTLLLDKTGTITFGNRLAAELFPVGGHSAHEVAQAALDASRGDDTPEGKSVVFLAQLLLGQGTPDGVLPPGAEVIPFSAETRSSGVRYPASNGTPGQLVLKGAADAIERVVSEAGARIPAEVFAEVGLAMNSGTAAAKEAANMVDLDSDPTKQYTEGPQWLIFGASRVNVLRLNLALDEAGGR